VRLFSLAKKSSKKPIEDFVKPRRSVPSEDAHEREQEHHGLQQRTPVRWGEDAKERKDQRHD